MIGFVNSRTGARTNSLSGYPTETEAEAVARLKAAGWDMVAGSYTFDESTKKFEFSAGKENKGDKPDEEEGAAEGDSDGSPDSKPE